MNILIDIRCLLEKNYSGVPSYTCNLLKNLFKIDSKNQYFLFYNKYGKVEDSREIKELLNYKNVELVQFSFPNKIFNFLLRFLKYPKLDNLVGKKVNKKIDICFLPNPNFVAVSKDCKVILTIHDLSFELYPEFFANKKNIGLSYIRGRFWHKYVGVKKLCKSADKIIAVSESTRHNLVDIYNIDEGRVDVVYEGVEESRIKNQELKNVGAVPCACPSHAEELKNVGVQNFEPKSPKVVEKYSLPDKFILFVGTLEPRKNIESIIRAFERIDTDHSLIIAGKKGWLYQDLFKIAEKSKMKDRIKFIGYVDEEDKFELYTLASLFVFPSFYEGFGLPPLEAMSCGCPVITSNSSSLPEVVGDAGLLVDPYNVNELAFAMSNVLNDDDLRQRMIEKGLERAKMFGWEKVARESLELF